MLDIQNRRESDLEHTCDEDDDSSLIGVVMPMTNSKKVLILDANDPKWEAIQSCLSSYEEDEKKDR